jgi:hypothetical protein
MGPLEIDDARLENNSNFAPAAVLFDADGGPWKNLSSRDCQLMTRIPVSLASFREANVLRKRLAMFCLPHRKAAVPRTD